MIEAKIIRKLANAYMRYCEELGLGEADCWRFAIDTVQGEITQEQLDVLAEIVKEAECGEYDR